MSLNQAIIDSLKGNFVLDEVKEERLKICELCEFKKGTNCMKCLCFVSWKARMPKEKCPVNKWSEYDNE